METNVLKLDLIQWVASLQDANILEQLLLLKDSQEGNRRSYTLPGEPMSEDEFHGRIEAARARIKAGEYTEMEELEKEMEKW